MEMIGEAVRLFHRGGFVMYPLLACSLIVVTIGLERFHYYRRSRWQADGSAEDLQAKLSTGDWNSAIALCEQSSGVVGRVLAAGLRFHSDVAGMKDAFESAMAWETANLRKYLGHLDLIVTLSPLLGLLGTVLGMISSFSVLDVTDNNPAVITGGVGEALVATATGLAVAILALVIHGYFCHRLDSLITDVERNCALAIGQAKGEQA